ncbi:dihydropteroate synthase [Cylindrospermopsis raciborskii]|uniref:Dihydropteroate synthase n=1 Tax=Cylindrospermopsis raciborskii CENA302 TaxID=1170768 RepID=A0A9Q5QZ53_9CYAN|nr:dihydropteroate synthase [Cylindrospermopsis raciborskii]NLQ04963.1 dihydropteroate synthase [Cylindrospermopsis raciborskii MVCC19]OHY34948.1 dihydropteroate synthase [Cylindrospermopsis raciborskii MVCC14]OPH11289.1 dihydropteroate synthase [Cylindrospermopsis raciborskii CENA302]
MANQANKLVIRQSCFNWGTKTYLMGILNVTPDSFSDGGEFNTIASALAQARAMIAAGADIIDIGGQSTRPGAQQVTLTEEMERVLSVIKVIRPEVTIPISIDTTRASVAQAAVQLGADMVNDISGGTYDPEMLSTVASLDVPIVLMHIRGTPQTMQEYTQYQDVMGEIYDFLSEQINTAITLGIKREKIIIDPGIGFAKNYQQNLEIIRELSRLKSLELPILVGPSRKSFIGQILNQPNAKDRVWGTAAVCCAAIFHGADILRVHDVNAIRDVSLVADAIYKYG